MLLVLCTSVVPKKNENRVLSEQMMTFATVSILLLIKIYFFADPPINEYKAIYKNFQEMHGYKVHYSHIANYFYNTYKIPHAFINEILKKYRTSKDDVTEEEFLELMIRWYNIKINNLHERIAIFKKIDSNNNNYITYNSFLQRINNTKTSEEIRREINMVVEQLEFSRFYVIDFFDFLTFINTIDPHENITSDIFN